MKSMIRYSYLIPQSTGGKRRVHKAMATEAKNSIEAKAEVTKFIEADSIVFEEFAADIIYTRISDGTMFIATKKGHGDKVHLSYFSNGGGFSTGPICGSGTCHTGTKHEYTARATKEKVTCSKCLSRGGLERYE